jgi:hypothetical protein
VLSEGWDSKTNSWIFSSFQDITNDQIDIYDQVKHSIVKSYNAATGGAFMGLDDITYVSRDKFGNVLFQQVQSFNDEAKTVRGQYREVTNVYADDKTAKLGNAKTTTVERWNGSKADANRVDKTVTETDLFDNNGRALHQIQNISVWNAGAYVPTQRNDITFANYNNRNDAGTQTIKSVRLKTDGTVDAVIDTKVFTNRNFDASHNISNQMVLTYSDATNVPAIEVQEIRSYGYNAQGVAQRQQIITYSDEAKTSMVSAQEILNNDIDPSGNVHTRIITNYAGVTFEAQCNF